MALLTILAAAPASAQEAAVQTIRGQVVDRDTRTPLPGASVVVLGTDPILGTTTNTDGRFILRGVPLGRRDIEVRFLGYQPAVMAALLVTSGKEVILDVALTEQVVTGEELVVTPGRAKDRPLNEMAVASARTFSVEETRRYAGGADDPARMASSFAGVTAGTGVSDNAISIRGNAPKGVQWRLEGVEIPNPSHFAGLSVAGGGGITLFSAHLLADSDFLTGAFPAEYGNVLGGVFDMNFRAGNAERREHAVQVGVLGIDLASEGPFASGRPSSYLFNYRYSTIGLLMPLLPTEDVATYQDLSFKLDFPGRRFGRLEVWGIGGLDGQRFAEEPDSSKWKYDFWDRLRGELTLGVGAAGISHTAVLGPRTFARSVAAVTVNRTRWEQQRLDDRVVLQDHLMLENSSGRMILGSTIQHKFSPRHVNRSGFQLHRLFYDFDLRSAPGDAPPLVPISVGQGGANLLQAYTQSRLELTPTFSLNAGLHAQHFALTGRSAIEPRVGLRWSGFSMAYGLHSQLEELRIYLVAGLPNRSLDFARAHHVVAGYDRSLGRYSRLKIEAYRQMLFRVPVIADSSFSMLNFEQDWTFAEALVNVGRGRNQGIEVTAERFLHDGYYYLLTGSLFSSRYRGGDGVWRSTRFDRRYALNGLFGYETPVRGRHLFGLNTRLVLTGGRRTTPVDEPASRLAESVVLDERLAFADSEPPLFLLDVTLTYRLNRRRFSEVWALQVKNVLAAKDRSLDYNYSTRRVDEIRDGYPLPVISYKIEF